MTNSMLKESLVSDDAAAHAQLSDLKMVKLCAEAMGTFPYGEGIGRITLANGTNYNPLLYDAQAMALVKRFGLDCFAPEDGDEGGWDVTCQGDSVRRHFPTAPHGISVTRPDLNRAIVECVARMQISKRAAAVPDEATTPVKRDEAQPNNPAVCPTDDEERK